MTAAGTRRAALLLHALPPPDRQWLLGSLPAAQRTALQSLLQELQTLGIEPDPGMLQRSLAPASHPLQELQPWQVAYLARWLAAQPALVTVRLLAAHAWQWQGALLAQLPAPHAAAVRAGLRLPRAPALEQAVLQVLVRQVEGHALSQQAGLRAWLRRCVPTLSRRSGRRV